MQLTSFKQKNNKNELAGRIQDPGGGFQVFTVRPDQIVPSLVGCMSLYENNAEFKTNLEVSQQEYSCCNSSIIEGKFSHFVFNVENPGREHRHSK